LSDNWRLEKLIRDRIPGLGAEDPRLRIANPSEVRQLLADKLLEEAIEVHQAVRAGAGNSVREELADVLEVARALASDYGFSVAELEAARTAKLRDRGGFQSGHVLSLDPAGLQRIHAGPARQFGQVLLRELGRCSAAHLAVAFILQSGLDVIVNALAAALNRGVRVRFLTTDYLHVTEPDALERLIALPGDLDVRVHSEPGRSFHPKSYLFEYQRPGRGTAFIGSSNLSRSALQGGVEWNYEIMEADPGWPLHEFVHHFEALFASPRVQPVTPTWISGYRGRRRPRSLVDEERETTSGSRPVPRPAQLEALAELNRLRAEGETAGLVIAATGIGKTYLAAFDARDFGRVLFVAHRVELLEQAERTFRAVRPELRTGFLTGDRRDYEADALFASVQTLSQPQQLAGFEPGQFSYLVVDEFHHAAASSYRAILDHFRPAFLLGLTATPYRVDNRDIFAICDGNVAYRVTLFEAIGFGWLCPFRYHGIRDQVDYDPIPWRKGRYSERELSNALGTERRARAILSEFRRHRSGAALGFCVSIAHAEFMAGYFNRNGVDALAVHSGAAAVPRQQALQMLAGGDLRILFAVDLFNEGLDVPQVDLVMFLRPTESMTVFLQQLGRGLRLHPGKTHLTALDFIGNYRNAHYKLPLLLGREDEPDPKAARQALAEFRTGGYRDFLPEGVELELDIDVINLLERLARKGDPLKARLLEAFRELQSEFGRRPSLLEMDLHGRYRARQYRQTFGNWFAFLDWAQQLTPDEENLEREVGPILAELETTSMTRSYKMVVLSSFLDLGGLSESVSVSDIVAGFRAFFREAKHARDLRDTPIKELSAVEEEQLRLYVERNPLKAWHNSSLLQWDRETSKVRYMGPKASNQHAFEVALRERIAWRLHAHFERRYERRDLYRVIGSGSDRSRATIKLGDGRDELPRGQGWKVVLVDGERHYAKFARNAIEVIQRRPTGDQGEPNLLSGIIADWFGSEGHLPGKGNRVRILPAPGEPDVWIIQPAREPRPAAEPLKAGIVPFELARAPGPTAAGEAVPRISLQAAASAFGSPEAVEVTGWVKPTTDRRLEEGMFVARVEGHSMEPLIPDGAWCLFRRPAAGSRTGRVLLIQHRSIDDPETGGSYTVKRFDSSGVKGKEEGERRGVIILKPDNPAYSEIRLTDVPEEELQVIAEFVEVLPSGGAKSG
jgi:superfamily II DNA or RNA helicase/HKD family nuclease/predicted house-cleaning noncanonical NTP pyrophosphatase (MazG superfamily)/phage repressor protein C with HTH and peptisase S24 domain